MKQSLNERVEDYQTNQIIITDCLELTEHIDEKQYMKIKGAWKKSNFYNIEILSDLLLYLKRLKRKNYSENITGLSFVKSNKGMPLLVISYCVNGELKQSLLAPYDKKYAKNKLKELEEEK